MNDTLAKTDGPLQVIDLQGFFFSGFDHLPHGFTTRGCPQGQLEGLLTAPGGRWRVRCGGCGVGE